MTGKIDPKLLHGKDLSEHLKNVREQEEAQKRTKDCEDEIVKILEKYNCILDAVMIVGRSGNMPQVTIVAKK